MQDEERNRLEKIIDALNERLDKEEGKAERYKALFWLLLFFIVASEIIQLTSK